MYVVRGVLSPEVGAMLMRAVEAVGDALFVAGGKDRGETDGHESGSDAPEPAQLRADAVGLLAERAVAAGFGNRTAGAANPAPVSGSRAERYQVMLHVVRSMPGTADVGSRAVGSPSPTPITSCTGQMAEKPS